MLDKTALIDLLLETGMLQFGEFQHGGEIRSFRFGLEMLPAYPDVLKQIATDSSAIIEKMGVQRLVAAPDAIPYGVALSLATDIPLIYSRGKGEDPAYDLVGAYDSGNRAVLICNVLIEPDSVLRVVECSRRVGLDVCGVLAVVAGEEGLALEVEVEALLTLPAIGAYLIERHKMPESMARNLL